MIAVYFALTALMTLALGALLWRPGPARPLSVWLLAALLPVLVSVTAALSGQQSARQTLAHFSLAAQPRTLAWRDALGQEKRAELLLSGQDAACVVRAIDSGGTYRLSKASLFIPAGATLLGDWPTPAQAQALLLTGQLACRKLTQAGL